MSPRLPRLALVLVSIAVVGCAPAPIDGDASVRADGDRRCSTGGECDDGVFCNGAERCDPGASACVAGEPPCGVGTFCNEADARCEASCALDADGDGHASITCGGDDCDDGDAGRHPTAVEVCDAEHVDEDCDPTTLGDRDADGDGSISQACCNDLAGVLRCGDDCDDASPGVHRTASEVCDDVDNDCDGEIDERVSFTLWPDADRDSFGDADGTPMRACSYLPGHALIGEDCDDSVATTNPGVHDVCNGVDDDCDGAIDEGADALCAAVEGASGAACVHLTGEAAPRCSVTGCLPERLDCNLDPSDGCEADFCRDLAHCSACFGYRGSCDAGICVDGRCFPSGSSLSLVWGTIVRARDATPIEGASVSRARECGGRTIATSSATGAYALGWDYEPQFVLFRTEAAGYATQIDGASSWEDIRLLELTELDTLLAMSPVPIDRRLGVVIVDAPGEPGHPGVAEVVEPVSGLYRAPAIAASASYAVALPDGWIRQVFVNVRPGTARVRVSRAGDGVFAVVCNEISPMWAGTWDAPIWHDTVVSGDAIVHVRFGWCSVSSGGG